MSTPSKSAWTLDTRVGLAPDAESRVFERQSDGKLFVVEQPPNPNFSPKREAIRLLKEGVTVSQTIRATGMVPATVVKIYQGLLVAGKLPPRKPR